MDPPRWPDRKVKLKKEKIMEDAEAFRTEKIS
jgi:hypothetical protein